MVIPALPILAAAGAGLFAALAEALHARRVARVAHLAFGPGGRPAPWTQAAPWIRVFGLAAAVWGAAVLLQHDPVAGDQTPSPRASKQLLIALDVSPSMLIEDAGPDAEKVSRSVWAGKVVQGILDRLDMKETRITLVAFYTKALTVLQDTTDKNVISNMFDGLRLHVAFEQGQTDLASGVNAALEVAKPWARRSTTLVVISDGDAKTTLGNVNLPPAIADTIVIGVGDPHRPTVISGHSSKQETWSLKQLAARLGGYYHEGNRLHLPSEVLKQLAMIAPNPGQVIGLREAALLALVVGCSLTALIGPALMLAGLRLSYVRQRRGVSTPPPARTVPAGT
jgi:Ca-activated chloride channel family protein